MKRNSNNTLLLAILLICSITYSFQYYISRCKNVKVFLHTIEATCSTLDNSKEVTSHVDLNTCLDLNKTRFIRGHNFFKKCESCAIKDMNLVCNCLDGVASTDLDKLIYIGYEGNLICHSFHLP